MIARIVKSMLDRYDKNHNGVFDRDEWGEFRSTSFRSVVDIPKGSVFDTGDWSEFRSNPSSADRNQDGRIDGREMTEWIAGRFGSSGLSGSGLDPRTSYRSKTTAERLAEFGLDDWFLRCDADGDGQLMMSEFAADWSDEVVDNFAAFDLNADGVITPGECKRATETGAVWGGWK